jgi:ketosteroid isomerase-like protein
MTPEEFVTEYERALGTQSWVAVEPLIHDDACVTFSTGAVHKGKQAVQAAYEANFKAITDERYRIANVHWVLQGRDTALYLFDFEWSGMIDGREASGKGRGTAALIVKDERWQLIAEHLGPASR